MTHNDTKEAKTLKPKQAYKRLMDSSKKLERAIKKYNKRRDYV